MPKNTPVPVYRGERILAYMAASIVVVSVLCFFALLIGRLAGVADFSVGVWPVVSVFPLIGLPIAVILIVSLVIVGGIRRSRETAVGDASGSAKSPSRSRGGGRSGSASSNARGAKGGETGRQSKDARR